LLLLLSSSISHVGVAVVVVRKNQSSSPERGNETEKEVMKYDVIRRVIEKRRFLLRAVRPFGRHRTKPNPTQASAAAMHRQEC